MELGVGDVMGCCCDAGGEGWRSSGPEDVEGGRDDGMLISARRSSSPSCSSVEEASSGDGSWLSRSCRVSFNRLIRSRWRIKSS